MSQKQLTASNPATDLIYDCIYAKIQVIGLIETETRVSTETTAAQMENATVSLIETAAEFHNPYPIQYHFYALGIGRTHLCYESPNYCVNGKRYDGAMKAL